ncbi:hypothetical protein N0V84_011450 [Fusarium piperis]|uniref:GPI inositol-deacylase winged helix domain-containing protein n=1 Tax=Fusarium piperis TaxID=1435070 RepID=A0A9W8TAF6_9HYPO|nr:hypothetical protein N0V84_011450 [Fusarium piperis]
MRALRISHPLSAGTSSYNKRSRFLLAQIFLDSLDDKLTPKSIRSGLKDFRQHSQGPGETEKVKALDYAYEQAMERINNQKPGLRSIALQVLAWITCAKRPLTKLELQHALAVELGATELDEENLPDLPGTVSACCGLVTIENQTNIIRLVHYTTQEYFERHRRVFESGFCYKDEALIERLHSNPLYDYVTQHWGHHAREASSLEEQIIEFLESGPKVEAAGQALLCSTRYRRHSATGGGTDPSGVTGLHLAAYFDLDAIMRSLLESDKIDPNAAASFKWHGDMTALSYAAQMGHEAIVKLLLEKGNVDPDAKNASKENWGRTPLSYAAENGHESIVKMLIKTRQVDINSEDTMGSFGINFPPIGLTPLIVAAKNGHYGIVKVLLDHGADAAHQPIVGYEEKGKSALAWAAENGHEDIVKLLRKKLESDAESEEKCN